MISSAFQLAEQIRLHAVRYILYKEIWDRYQFGHLDLKFANWTNIKYLNDQGTDFNQEIELLPNDKGGLYLFYVACPIIPGLTEFPFYVGRAQLTEGQNLRKRIREYFTKWSKSDERPKITLMFEYWATELRVAFITLADNASIRDLEKNLINSTLFPMNDQIPDQETREAIKAFSI